MPSKRGFASMDPERRREIASRGGKAAHAQGKAHQWTPEQAREAGRKGGNKVAEDREHMMRIGMKGGTRRGELRREEKAMERFFHPDG